MIMDLIYVWNVCLENSSINVCGPKQRRIRVIPRIIEKTIQRITSILMQYILFFPIDSIR